MPLKGIGHLLKIIAETQILKTEKNSTVQTGSKRCMDRYQVADGSWGPLLYIIRKRGDCKQLNPKLSLKAKLSLELSQIGLGLD